MRRFCLALLILAPLIVVGPPLLTGRSIGAYDQIQAMQPWNGPAPEQAWDVLQADSVLQTYAWRDLVLDAWRQGQIPQWNPYELGGTPLLANSQSGAMYPPHIFLGLLKLPTGTAIVLLAWLHLALAGLGLRSLALRFGGNESGACIGGLSFQLSSFMLGWIGLGSVASTVCWIPWLLFGVAIVAGDEPHTSAWRPAGVVVTALSSTLMLLGGHLQFAFYGFLAAGLLLAGFTAWKASAGIAKATAVLGLGILAIGLGVGMSAPQLLPTMAFSKHSHRQNVPTEEGYAAYVGLALQPHELIGRLASPFAHGNPTKWADEERITLQFWPAISKPGANFAESAATLGPVVLVGIALLAGRRLRWIDWVPWGAMGLLSLAMAMGTPIDRLFYFGVPGWSSTGSPGRIIVIFVLCACVLAAIGFSRPKFETLKEAFPAIIGGVILLALGSMAAVAPAPEGVDPGAWKALVHGIHREALVGALIAWVISAAAAYLLLSRRLPKWASLGALAPIGFVFATGLQTAVRSGDPTFLHSPQLDVPTFDRVAIVNEAWSFTHVPTALMPPNTASISRIHEAAGYDSLLEREVIARLNQVNGQDSFPPHNGNLGFVKPSASATGLHELGVLMRYELQGGSISLTKLGGMRASIDGRPAEVVGETYSSVRVRASGPGVLVLSDRQQPKSWTAYVDGVHTPLQQAYNLRLELTPGEHVVDFKFEAPGLQGGLLGCLCSALALSVAAAALWRRRKFEIGLEAEAKSL